MKKLQQTQRWMTLGLGVALMTAMSACDRSNLPSPASINAPGRSIQTTPRFNSFRGVRTGGRNGYVKGDLVIRFRQRPTQGFVQQFAVQNGLRYSSASTLGSILFKQLNTSEDINATIQRVKQNPMVSSVSLNTQFRRQFTINDPKASEQSGLAIIGAGKAWDLTIGSPNVTIAVIDSGVDLQHPDLQANLVPGFNAINPGQPPQDDNGHGTHSAGIAAAAGDNGVGVTGSCPRCKIMPIKALDATGGGNGFQVAQGVVWAVDNGAQVINMSLGGEESDVSLEQAVKYALSRNVTVVVAAGNNSTDTPMYPAALPGVISVGSVDVQRQISSFSNYGSWVSVVAPGSGILSTMPVASSYMTENEGFNPEYDLMDGTSMASPMVAGVVGLIKSRHPQLTPAQIKQRLEGTAIDLGEPGFDLTFANGMVDAFRALL